MCTHRGAGLEVNRLAACFGFVGVRDGGGLWLWMSWLGSSHGRCLDLL